jgi:hypothetical protein
MRAHAVRQKELQRALDELMVKVRRRAAALPETPEFLELRVSAEQFADAVDRSGASGMMTDAETALTLHDGATGHEKADGAAKALDRLLSRAGGMGKNASASMGKLTFRPSLASAAQATMEQLLKGMRPGRAGFGSPDAEGRGSGSGMSAFTGGQNVGLYGNLPTMQGGRERGGQLDRSLGRGTLAQSDASEFQRASPDADWNRADLRATSAGGTTHAVPTHYQQRVDAYFERILDELPPQEEAWPAGPASP